MKGSCPGGKDLRNLDGETRGRLGRVWGGILALYRQRPNTGSAGAELVSLVFTAEDLLNAGKPAPAVEALSRAEELLEDLGAGGAAGPDAQTGGDGERRMAWEGEVGP